MLCDITEYNTMNVRYQSLFGALQVIKLVFRLTDQLSQLLKTGAYQLYKRKKLCKSIFLKNIIVSFFKITAQVIQNLNYPTTEMSVSFSMGLNTLNDGSTEGSSFTFFEDSSFFPVRKK